MAEDIDKIIKSAIQKNSINDNASLLKDYSLRKNVNNQQQNERGVLQKRAFSPSIKVENFSETKEIERSRSPAGSSGSGLPTPPSSGTYVLASINGDIQWIGTTNC